MENQKQKNAAELFDSPEKWNAFLELSKQSLAIQDYWWGKLTLEIMSKYKELENKFPDWQIEPDGNLWLSWKLQPLPKKHLYIYFSKGQFGVYPICSNYEQMRVDTDLLQIKNMFANSGGNSLYDHTLIWETGNYVFGSEYDNNIPQENMAWYAGNETEEFAKQALKRVCQFLTPENTELFKKLAKKCT